MKKANLITVNNIDKKSQTGHTSFPMVITFVFIFVFIPYIAKVHALVFGKPEVDCPCYTEEQPAE